MRDERRIRERVEVHMDRSQVVWLTLGAVVGFALMFALGFIVGKRAERLGQEETAGADRIAQIETDQAMHDELTFYSKLTSPDGDTPKTVTPATKAEAAPKPAVVESSKPKPKPEQKAENTAQNLERALKRARKESSNNAPANVSDAINAGPAKSGEYTVQVSAFQSMGEAKAYAAGLTRKGYKPFVVSSSIRGRGTWYRVRLGRFVNQDDATQAKSMLARADIPAWVLKSE